MIIKEHNTKNKFRRWTSTRIEVGKRKMQIFNVHRIPESTQSRILKSRAQYDRVGSEVKLSREYRTEMLRDLTNEMNALKNKGTQGINITGDMNQDIASNQMQHFIRENGLCVLHQEMNDTDESERDRTFKNRQNQTDVMLGTKSILQATRGSKLIDFDEIIITDQRGFIFDIDINEYFKITASKCDKSEIRKLNPTNRKHQAQFKDTLEKHISQMGLMEKIIKVCTNRATQYEMNALDESITCVLTVARKKVKGMQRNMPFSITKQVKESKVKYIRGLINKKKGKRIDKGALKRQKEYYGVDLKELDIPELEYRYTEAITDWEVFKKEAENIRNQELLDLYPTDIIGDSDIAKKKRKQALKSIYR